jgi:hypothetical protein
MADTIDWLGKSGKTYRYWFLAQMTTDGILAVGGNYCFSKRLPNGNFLPLYFGETEDLQARLPTHERWEEAKRAGATHVWTHTTPAGEQARVAEEQDLIQQWNPPLNVQHRKVS